MGAKQKNVREIALDLLETIAKNQSYSNLLLNKAINNNQLSSRDASLLTEIMYGTLQRQMTLDFYLQPFVHRKLDGWVQQLLRLTIYQLVFLNKIPDHAAIYEAVELAKKRGHKGIANFVNGVLRSVQRGGVPSLESIKDPVERIAIETSHPRWLISRWIDQFGFERTKAMCEGNLVAPVQSARINEKKTTRESCMKLLEQEGFLVQESLLVSEGIRCLRGNLAHSTCFRDGLLTIQDESSMLVGYALGLRGDEQVLDACAAPGGKSTHIAEKLSETGRVVALDLHEHKVKLIQQHAERLGLTNITAQVMNSNEAPQHFPTASFDTILLDAPCSGLGVLRRKPDIKYAKQVVDLEKLHDVQLQLLLNVAPLLKKNGTLVYSTCTVNKQENEEIVAAFLAKNNAFEMDPHFSERMPQTVQPLIDNSTLQIFPQDFGTDGFFIACMRKKV